ncbi:hypothetical protein B0H10DRAFT_1147827 [Mycena sp. CBHHK59/15]|nr:hypothetical protein B0H10DRAFT_1147827 [Mycena sp. CBHHK59/15]
MENSTSTPILDPSKFPSGSVVITDSSSSRSFINTKQALDNAIPDRGRVVRPCGNCFKLPPSGGDAFARCGKCETVHYCGRQCQAAHWKEHKPVCKERVAAAAILAQQREAARIAGEKFCTPITLREWYEANSSVVEYAAVQALQLYKGVEASLQPTHVAVFKLRVDDTTPEDASLVRLLEVMPVPFSVFAREMEMSKTHIDECNRSTKIGYMTLYLSDPEESLHLLKFHNPPPSRQKEDKHWRLNVMQKLNAGMPTAV